MKVYQLRFGLNDANGNDDGNGTQLEWFSSKQSAAQRLSDLKRDCGLAESVPHSITEMEIPTTRAGLLRWLNVQFTSDNG